MRPIRPIRLIRPIFFLLSALLVAGVLIFLFSYFSSKSASAAWYDDSWAYRTPLTITHNATVTNNKVKFDLDTSTATGIGNKIQSDCGDSRFTDINGNLLRYYLDSANGACGTNSTDYYVLIPTIINGTTVIYHYYGNPSAPDGTEAANFSESTLTPSGSYTSGTEEKGKGPTLYFSFNDGQGTTAQDSSPNNLDGTLNNTPTWQTEDMCVAGKCLWFDGSNNENVSKADDAKLDFGATDNFTVSAWVKRNGASSAINYIISKHDVTDDTEDGGYKLWMDADGDFCFGIDDDITWGPDISACSTSQNFDDDRWHYVTGVRDQTGTDKIYLYVDGKDYSGGGTSDTTTATLANSNIFYVGVDRDGTSNEWLGFIDEVKVYPYARSQAQINADYTSRGSVKGVSAQMGGTDQKYLSEGLVGYWKMNESSGNASDSSGNSTTLTNVSTTAFTGGKFGSSADPDGTADYFQAADNTALSLTGDLTVSVWINPDTVDAGSYDIAGKWDNDGSARESYLLQQSGDEIVFYIDSASNYTTTDAANLTAAGGWYFVTATYKASSGTVAIYVNGQPQTTTITGTIPTSIGDDTDRFHVGAEDSASSATNFYNGQLDEIRVYNRTLSDKEVRDLYNWAPGPLHYWNFEEGSGTSSLDLGASSTTGTITGATYSSGKYGKSLNFNTNSDTINYGVLSSDMSGKNLTFEAWALRTSTTGNHVRAVQAGTGGTVSNWLGFWSTATTPTAIFRFSTAGAATLISDNSVGLNKWIHLAATYDGTTFTLWVNGVLDKSTTVSDSSTSLSNDSVKYYADQAAQNFLVGVSNNSTIQIKVDEVKVYNYARTQKQIVEDMNAGHPAVGSPVGSTVAHWKFDEGAENTCSGGSNDVCNSITMGTLDGTSTATRSNAGKFGKALNFDGSDDVVTITNANAIDFDVGLSSGVTFSAWINADDAGDTSGNGQIFIKNTNTWLRVENLSGSNLDISASVDLSTDATVTVSAPITTGTWNHVVMTWQDDADDEADIYVNGILKGSSTNGVGGTSADTANLSIGGTGTSTFDGHIDEFKLYNYALTADEVKTEYNRGSSMVLGTLSSAVSGRTSGSSRSEYCPPGNTEGNCAADTDPSPIGEWKLEEKSGTTAYDNSTTGNGLTLTNSPTYTTGKFGGGIDFAGSNQQLTRADDSDFDFAAGGSFTLESWIKHTSASAQEMILVKYAEAGYKLLMENDGDITCGIDYDSTWTPTDSVTSTAATYDDNKWHHVACAKSANTSLTLYIDGVSVGTPDTSLTNSTLENTDPLYVGIDADGTSNDWIGQIDQVSIFNYARTPAQVAWDYNRGKPVGHWKMDECQGTTLNDSSGNSYTGTITIGPVVGEDTVGDCNTSSTTWGSGATGKRNYSLSLDGSDDYVTITDTANLRFDASTADFSLFTWVKRTTTGTEYIISKEDADNDGYRLLFTSSNTVQCSEDATDVTSASAITDTNWHLVGCTTDRDGNGQVYIDGKADGSTAAMGTDAMATTSNITLGTRSYTSTSYFNGQIDDVQIFNYTLSATQVQNLYTNGAVNFAPLTGAP